MPFAINISSEISCPNILIGNSSGFEEPKEGAADVAYFYVRLQSGDGAIDDVYEYASNQSNVPFDVAETDGIYTVTVIILFAPVIGQTYTLNQIVYSEGVIYQSTGSTLYDGNFNSGWSVITLSQVTSYYKSVTRLMYICSSLNCFYNKTQPEICGTCLPEDICSNDKLVDASKLAILLLDLEMNEGGVILDSGYFNDKFYEYLSISNQICC